MVVKRRLQQNLSIGNVSLATVKISHGVRQENNYKHNACWKRYQNIKGNGIIMLKGRHLFIGLLEDEIVVI